MFDKKNLTTLVDVARRCHAKSSASIQKCQKDTTIASCTNLTLKNLHKVLVVVLCPPQRRWLRPRLFKTLRWFPERAAKTSRKRAQQQKADSNGKQSGFVKTLVDDHVVADSADRSSLHM